jgi:CubicO group peptidase (beta-lactamase class C family)
VVDGLTTKFPPGDRFIYCNSGLVVLALIAERASGVVYHDLVQTRVCSPAGIRDTEFVRSNDLLGRTGLGHLTMDGTWRHQRVPRACARLRRRRHLLDRRISTGSGSRSSPVTPSASTPLTR